MSDRRINPVTLDFIDAARGAFETCDVLENKIGISYSIEYGSWEGDPTLGHRFAEVAQANDTPATRRRIADLAKDAVRWLLDSGELSSVDVIVESYNRMKVAFEVRAYQAGGGVVKAGPYFVSVGG